LSLDLYTRFTVALVAILALLAAFAWLVRRYGVGGQARGGGKRRLAIVEVMPIDGKRRLILLRRDSTEHLVLLGPDRALLVESGIAAPPPPDGSSFAALVEGASA
jgi:flagellar protein FliO/FliZ